MKGRKPLTFIVALFALLLAHPAMAQDDEPDMTFDEDDADSGDKEGGDDVTFDEGEGEAEGEGKVDLDDLTAEPVVEGEDAVAPMKADQKGDEKLAWQDIVVVMRKPFLKTKRVELLPQFGITMNDNLVRHYQFSAAINYYLTDVLAVGIEGTYYQKDLREPFDLVARQARRLPTVNKYNYGASLNFHYVPIYGKFAVLDQHLIHWESYFTGGVGMMESEVLPRNPALQPFTNFLITPNVGVSMRFFLFKWMTVNLGIRDYIFVDQFEAQDRTEISGSAAKDNADSALINNVVFQVGLSFWVPPTFEYTTFR